MFLKESLVESFRLRVRQYVPKGELSGKFPAGCCRFRAGCYINRQVGMLTGDETTKYY